MTGQDHTSRGQIDAYILGDLEYAEVQALEAHLLRCPSCAALLQEAAHQEAELERVARTASPRVWRRPPAWAALTTLAAAAALFAVWGGSSPDPLPPIEVVLSGHLSEHRGTEPQPATRPTFTPGSRLQIQLIPAEDTGALQVRMFDLEGPSLYEIHVDVSSQPGQNTRVTTRLDPGTPLAEPGEHALLLVVGPADALLDPSALPSLDVTTTDLGPWRVLRMHIDVSASEPGPH